MSLNIIKLMGSDDEIGKRHKLGGEPDLLQLLIF